MTSINPSRATAERGRPHFPACAVRASPRGATVGGASGHPGPRFKRAHGTNQARPLHARAVPAQGSRLGRHFHAPRAPRGHEHVLTPRRSEPPARRVAPREARGAAGLDEAASWGFVTPTRWSVVAPPL